MNRPIKLAAFLTHPVQYYSPWFADLAKRLDLKVYYALNDTSSDQAQAGFGVEFNWDIDLLAGYESEYLNNVASMPRLAGFSGCDVPEVSSRLREDAPDAVLTFGWHKKYYWQVLMAAFRQGIPAFVRVDSQLATPRSSLKRALKYLPYSLVLPNMAHYLTPGERSTNYLRHYGVACDHIHAVPHMIDVERFAAGGELAAIEDIRAESGARPEQIVLLFVGKLIGKKHPGAIISALTKLSPEQRQQFVVWYVGSGELSAQIQSEADDAGINTHWLGFKNQSELPALYAAADCLVLPSDGGETWGLVVNEAFACGTPAIVSSKVGAGPELIEAGRTGWVVPFGDDQALATRLGELSRNTLQNMAIAVREKSREFRYETGSMAFIQAIERVVK